MLILGSQLWTTTGAGVPPAPPPPPDETPQPRGHVPWLTEIPGDRARSSEEVSRARARFGIEDDVALAAIAEVAARQAERDEQDEQKRFDELYRELELRRIEFDARYLEVLGALREDYLEAAREAHRRRLRDEQDLLVLLMLAAAAS